jgi:hypothetical protein
VEAVSWTRNRARKFEWGKSLGIAVNQNLVHHHTARPHQGLGNELIEQCQNLAGRQKERTKRGDNKNIVPRSRESVSCRELEPKLQNVLVISTDQCESGSHRLLD